MGKTAKIVLGVIALFAVACFVGAIVLAKVGKQKMEGFAHDLERQTAEARAWGASHAQGDCMTEGLQRVARCDGIGCQLQVQNFATVCLQTAAPTAGLCDGIPAPQDFAASGQWVNSRCMAMTGEQAMRCRNLVPVLQRHCVIQVMRASPSLTAPSAAPSM